MLVSEAIDRTLNNWLYPAGIDRPPFDTLNALLSDSATSVAVTGRLGSDGIPDDTIVEIESELILVSSVSGTTLTFNERGYLDTVAASHASGTKVWVDPDFPRKSIFNAIQAIVEGLAGLGLYKVSSDTFTHSFITPVATDSGTKDIVSPMQYLWGPDYYELEEGNDYKVLRTFDPPRIKFFGGQEGSTVTAMVKSEFTSPSTEADDLTTVCGVPASLARHISMAAAGMLLMGHEPSRLQIETVRRALASEGVQVGASLNVGQTLITQFEQVYVARERAKQIATTTPTRIVSR